MKGPASLILPLLLLLCSPVQAFDWQGLWRTPDQRGDQLLQAGDAKGAAARYADARRRAYAELQGKDYAAATRDLAALKGSDDHYNRGNGLALSGDLPGALKAYDAALAANPANRDAQHNRELVAKALQQQQEQQQKKSQDQSSNQGGKDQASPNDDGGKPGEAEQKKNAESQTGQGQQGSQQAAAGSKPQPGEGQEKNQSASADEQQKNQSAAGQKPASPTEGNDAAQAEREAAASAALQPGQKQPQNRVGRASAAAEDAAPQTEQQLAQEQWLRRIPDDPGGLLRRKFLIEHRMKQQQAQRAGP